jgi:hypothetical protein
MPDTDLRDLLRAFAAWLHHGPCTVRQLAGRSDLPMIELHPRTLELARLGAVREAGQSAADGPIWSASPDLVAAPTAADVVQRTLNTLAIPDQVSIAAAIMARHGRRPRHPAPGAELPLA